MNSRQSVTVIAAAKQGLQKLDVITGVSGKPVRTFSDLSALYDSAAMGEPLTLNIFREQRALRTEISGPAARVLDGRTADTGGSEPRPNFDAGKNFIGGWVNDESWIQWSNVSLPAGRLRISMELAATDQAAGNAWELQIADQIIPGKTKATGGWETFETVDLGTIALDKAGVYRARIVPRGKPRAGVMNVRALTIRPSTQLAPAAP